MVRVLLRVRHGSHLYGTATPTSDLDLYEVLEPVPGGNPFTSRYGVSRQALDGREDVVQKDLGQWLREVSAGVPQACEAAWADGDAVEVDLVRPLRMGLRVGSSGWAAHRQAMRNFATGYWRYGAGGAEYAMKRARHAVRLSRSLALLRRDGRYDPRLSPAEADRCRAVAANLGPGTELWELCDTIAFSTDEGRQGHGW